MDILRPALDQIAKIWARIDLMPVIRWGMVAQASPLRVQLDGDAAPMALTPMAIVGGLRAGDRVLCVEQHRRVIVLGRGRGSGPAAVASGRATAPAGGAQVAPLWYSAPFTVTFPAGRFTEPPQVLVSASGTGVLDASVQGQPTTTSFTAVVTRLNSALVADSHFLEWSATQMTDGSGPG